MHDDKYFNRLHEEYNEWKRKNPHRVTTPDQTIQRFVLENRTSVRIIDKLAEKINWVPSAEPSRFSPLKSTVHFLAWFYGLGLLMIVSKYFF